MSSSPDVQHPHFWRSLHFVMRGEDSSCLWHGSDVLICDPEADEQMLHYPLCNAGILPAHGFRNRGLQVP